jgi:HEAT repeat protein
MGPVLVLVPIWTSRFRTLAVVIFLLMHAGFAACLELGIFPYVCMVAWLALLPGGIWDRCFGAVAVDPAKEAAGPPRWIRRVLDAFCAATLVYVLLWNFSSLNPARFSGCLPTSIRWIGHRFFLAQNWNMFAPRPLTDDGWFVIHGELRSGTRVDLLHPGKAPSWAKPALASATFKNDRWREYLLKLWSLEHAALRVSYAHYLQRVWNKKHKPTEQLDWLRMYYMLEPTGMPVPQGARRVELLALRPDGTYVFPAGRVRTAPRRELIEALHNIDPMVRCSAVIALSQLRDRVVESPPEILDMIQDPSPLVRRAAVHALCDGGEVSPEVDSRMAGALHDAVWFVRSAAAECHGVRGAAAAQALPKLQALLADADADVRSAAIRAIEQIESALRNP